MPDCGAEVVGVACCSPGQGGGSFGLVEVPGAWWCGLIGVVVAQECGVRFWSFRTGKGVEVFVVDFWGCRVCEGEVLVGSGRWLFQEFAGKVWVADQGCGASFGMEFEVV